MIDGGWSTLENKQTRSYQRYSRRAAKHRWADAIVSRARRQALDGVQEVAAARMHQRERRRVHAVLDVALDLLAADSGCPTG
jgi:hypothetical protein